MGLNRVQPIAFPGPGPASFRAWAEIDLRAIKQNIKSLQSLFGPETKIMAVVKANAYGLGAIPIARAALEAGASSLVVSSCEEGVELREAGLPGQILVLGYIPNEGARLAVEAGLTVTVIEPEFARLLSFYSVRFRSPRNPLSVQIKLDSGLHRYGLEPEKTLEFARLISALPGLTLQGLYTHFATADEKDPSFVQEQIRRFDQAKDLLASNGFQMAQEHLANSAAALDILPARRGSVRIGLAMLGYYPSPLSKTKDLVLKPSFSLRSLVARLSTLEAGEAVGYNRTFTASEEMKIALIPVGYADGYRRALSNKGTVLIGGKRAEVLGRIMMDQFVVNVTGHENIKVGDEVILVGSQGENQVALEEVAQACGTIPYEILTGIGPRINRLYLE